MDEILEKIPRELNKVCESDKGGLFLQAGYHAFRKCDVTFDQ